MKSSMKKVVLGTTTVLAAGAAGQAVKAASTNVPIQARILAPISITQTRSMNFGILTDGGAGGTATLNNADTISGTTGATSAAGGTVQSGGFKISAATGVAIDVTGPANTTISDGGGNTMTVDQFTINAAAGTINATAFVTTLGAATVSGFRLGGRLTVGAAQANGTYNVGNVAITANYQ